MWILLAIVVAGVICAVADAVVSGRSPRRRPRRGGRLPAQPAGGSTAAPLLQAHPVHPSPPLSAYDDTGPVWRVGAPAWSDDASAAAPAPDADDDRRAGSWTEESPGASCESRDGGSSSADTSADSCSDGGGSYDGGSSDGGSSDSGSGGSWD